MLESNINAGKQDLNINSVNNLSYGVSITDSCISFKETEDLVKYAYEIL